MKEYKDTQIPHQLIDIVKNLLDKRTNLLSQEQYYARLKTIKKFVDEALKEYERKQKSKRY